MDLLGSLLSLIAVLICIAIWMLPIVFIALSDRTEGKEKAAWILAVIFISWFAWVFYLLLAPIKPRSAHQVYR
jgi:hypothetical protein